MLEPGPQNLQDGPAHMDNKIGLYIHIYKRKGKIRNPSYKGGKTRSYESMIGGDVNIPLCYYLWLKPQDYISEQGFLIFEKHLSQRIN